MSMPTIGLSFCKPGLGGFTSHLCSLSNVSQAYLCVAYLTWNILFWYAIAYFPCMHNRGTFYSLLFVNHSQSSCLLSLAV